MSQRKENFQNIVLHVKILPLLQRLQELDDACNDIEEYFHEYDYRDVPANGFRTFVTIVDLFFESLSRFADRRIRTPLLLQEYETLSIILSRNAAAAALIRAKGLDYPLQCTQQDCEILEKFVDTEPKDMRPLFANVGIFYVKEEYHSQYQQTLTLMSLVSATSLLQQVRIMISPRYRARVQATNAVTMTVRDAKSLRLNQFPISILLKLLRNTTDVDNKWISVSRDNSEWFISLPDLQTAAVIHLKNSTTRKGKPIKCMLMQPHKRLHYGNESRSLMFYVPGGAFVTGSAKITIMLMSKCCRALGVPILMPEYRRAPENPFPAAVQDILDAYMFVASGDAKVERLLGFHPENILLAGDSAGGQLAAVLVIVLNEIRKMEQRVKMPKAISLLFPAMTVGFVAHPAALLSGLDVGVSLGWSRLTALLYAECEPKIDPKSLMNQKHTKLRDIRNRNEIMQRFNDRLRDPLHNPLVYEFFEDLKDIPMSILACEMDSLIDNSVLMANKWKGPLVLDVARGLPHGFLMGRETPAVAEEMQRFIQRLASALDIQL